MTFVHPTLSLDLTLSDYYYPFAALKQSWRPQIWR